MENLGKLVTFIVNSLFNAFVFWKLWEWFVVPLGVVEISFWHAYGLGLFGTWLGILIMTSSMEDLAKRNSQGNRIFFIKTMAMTFTLGFGWIAHFLGTL